MIKILILIILSLFLIIISFKKRDFFEFIADNDDFLTKSESEGRIDFNEKKESQSVFKLLIDKSVLTILKSDSKKSKNGRCGPNYNNTICPGTQCCSNGEWCSGTIGKKSDWCHSMDKGVWKGREGGKYDGDPNSDSVNDFKNLKKEPLLKFKSYDNCPNLYNLFHGLPLKDTTNNNLKRGKNNDGFTSF